jgi:SpoVK/Ycf46/Vps4 family AAA+-type ATPase
MTSTIGNIQDCLTVKSTTHLPLPVLKEKARNENSEHFCALSPDDMIKLFGRTHFTAEDYVFASDRVFSVVCFKGLESGVVGFSSKDETLVNTGFYSKLGTICRVTEQGLRNLVLKEATATIISEHSREVEISYKRLFVQSLKKALKNTIFEKDESLSFEYAINRFRVSFDFNSPLKSGKIAEATKLRLRKRESDKIVFLDNFVNFPSDTIFKLFISIPFSSTGTIQKSQLEAFTTSFLSAGEVLNDLRKESKETYNGTQYKIRIDSIQAAGKIYAQDKIARYKLPEKFKIVCSFENGIKVVDDPVVISEKEPVKLEPIGALPQPLALVQPIKERMSFGQFLESKGLFGITPEMIKEIEVVLDYYGPERADLDAFGIYPTKALLFFGEPGNGKTKVVEQIAAYLNIPATHYTKITASDLLGGIVGSTEANIRNVFAAAEKEAKEKGDKSSLHLIFFDEIDALGMSRESATQSHDVSKVTALLGKIDGVEDCKNVLVIASTNCLDKLDSALKREGRFSMVEFKNPNEALRATMFRHYLSNPTKRYKDGFNFELVAKISEGLSAADIKGISNKARFDGYERVKKLRATTKMSSTEMSVHEAGMVTEIDLFPLIKKLRIDKKIVLNEIISNLIEEKMKEDLKKKEEDDKLEAKKKEREREVLQSMYS